MLPLITFWLLVVATAVRNGSVQLYRRKPLRDWLLDLAGLAVQGALIPVLQIVLVAALWGVAKPGLRQSVDLPGPDALGGFLLSFAVVDYVYYWNHRLLHQRSLWPAHLVHHTVSEMDVLGTSRNTLWTSLLICYVWLHGSAVYLLHRPDGYLCGAALGASLDLWRHSQLDPPPWLARWLDPWLVLPRDHGWHHATPAPPGNYGANLKLWDRLHGTWLDRSDTPDCLGVKTPMTLTRQLLWPVVG